MERVRIGFLHHREELHLYLPAGTRLGLTLLDAPGEWRLAAEQAIPALVQPALKVLESADRALVEATVARLSAHGAILRDHAPGGRWREAHVLPTWLVAVPLGELEDATAREHMLREQSRPEDHILLASLRKELGDLAGVPGSVGPPALWHMKAPVRTQWIARPQCGRILLEGPGGVMAAVDSPLRIVLPESALAQVGDVRVGIGFHWDHLERLGYEDTLEAWVEPGGHLGLVNELPLERYLTSVNSSEMTADSPHHLLCAQTVAARSTILATRGRHHAGEPFDICADDHCQCFRGCGTIREASALAARETAGQVLAWGGHICDARYSKSCGGIVEAYEHVWEDQPVPYMPSFRDTCAPDPHFLRPTSEEGWRAWICSSEDVWCNTEAFQLPVGLAYSDGFYRWQLRLERQEAADHIRRVTGLSFQQLLDLVPGDRGLSGRLRSLVVRTDAGDFIIGKELTIRLALWKTCLYSAAIVLDWEGDVLVITGKGWGHGVGMCQLGATRMALEGRPWREILHHYYPLTAISAL
jgi:SpoIID/LytB domain protein